MGQTSLQPAITAQADLHHQFFLGLQLMVAVEQGREVVGDWMFRLFRRQHEDKFLSSFEKLGLSDLPHAVACAKYHVLSNGVGGVRVEYMESSPKKAWVRFRYPRWMYMGPAICGIPVEASRGFLRGWYAQNGVTLGNPRLGYVCVSEDLTGQFGLCGYFKEYDHDLSPEERLQFAPDEVPPPFDPDIQPAPPAEHWSAERLAKAGRNYAMEYCRNGMEQLAEVIGTEKALDIGKRAARLTGLQNYALMAAQVGAVDGDVDDAAAFLVTAFSGMGDTATFSVKGRERVIRHSGLRITRGMKAEAAELMMSAWIELWRGAINAHRAFMTFEVSQGPEELVWRIAPRSDQGAA